MAEMRIGTGMTHNIYTPERWQMGMFAIESPENVEDRLWELWV